MKIENIAIDVSKHYKSLFIKHRFQSMLRRVFSRYYVRKLDKDIIDMRISGEEIRQEAEKREQTCSSGMKGSFYYGFREGAKWGIKEQKAIDDDAIHAVVEEQVLRAIEKQKSIDDTELADVKKERDAYYDELLKLRAEKAEGVIKLPQRFRKALDREKQELIEKACEWLCENIGDYARIGEDGAWVEHSVVADFKKALEE